MLTLKKSYIISKIADKVSVGEAAVMVTCWGDAPEIRFVTNNYLGYKTSKVYFKFNDDGEIESQEWYVGKSSKSIIVDFPIKFINKMLISNNVVVQSSNDVGTNVSMKFELNEFSGAFSKIKANCDMVKKYR